MLTSFITVLCNYILLLSLVLSSFAASIPANIPESDLPFEFNYDKGSEVIGENILTQSVSSDGKTVFSSNSPQPIKKYDYGTKSEGQSTNPTHDNEIQTNKYISYKKPQGGHVKTNRNKSNNYSTYISPMDINQYQWNILENISKYIPEMMSNVRVIYI